MLRPRPRLRALILALGTCLSGPACVLPHGGATGLEVTWTLREANAVDGQQARRRRTCAGAGVVRVALDVRDAADPTRTGRFVHPCAAGDLAPAARATETPEIFLDLRAGSYAVTATALSDRALASAGLAAEVAELEVVTVDLELTRPLQPVALALAGAASCQRLRAVLRYADPAADLHPDDADAPPPAYRAALRSDRGLFLGGDATPCDPDLDGPHTLAGVDPGRYVLDLEVDGRRCEVAVQVEDSPAEVAVDLENPACGG